jgi:hypothetical protein
MTTETAATTRSSTLPPAEQRALRALRTRYQQDAHLFSQRERPQLLFLRWLYQTGQLTETPCCPPEPGKEVPMMTP